jgi:hypothetical protein
MEMMTHSDFRSNHIHVETVTKELFPFVQGYLNCTNLLLTRSLRSLSNKVSSVFLMSMRSIYDRVELTKSDQADVYSVRGLTPPSD